MLKFNSFLAEAAKKKKKEILENENDASGKLYEILSGSYLKHGYNPNTGKPNKFMTHFRDENGDSPEEIHDRIKKSFPDLYDDTNTRAKGAADHLRGYLSENGHDDLHDVAWTSQPSDHESFTGEADPNSDADIMFMSKNPDGSIKEPVGVSLKYGKQLDPNLRNQGMSAIEDMAGLESGSLSDLRKKHYDFIRDQGVAPGVAGDAQYKELAKAGHPTAAAIDDHALNMQRNMAALFAKGMQNKSSEEIKRIVSGIIAPPTKFQHLKMQSRINPNGSVTHKVEKMREHTDRTLNQYEEYRMRPHEGGISTVIEGRRMGQTNFEPAVQIGFKKSRTFSGHGFASFAKAPMLRERQNRGSSEPSSVVNKSKEEAGSGEHGAKSFYGPGEK
jgi:hypothetical protein